KKTFVKSNYLFLAAALLLLACDANPPSSTENDSPEQVESTEPSRLPMIFDTDANNELDDQHAMAYLLMNQQTFDVKGITVNATYNGGDIDKHYQEAERVLVLCNEKGKIPLIKGANADFASIRDQIKEEDYDGKAAVDFIIEQAKAATPEKPLIMMAVGKLTNMALAALHSPDIIPNVRLVWLGSNYPEPGEYNQDNDTVAMNHLLDTSIPFEMVTVRYGKPSGTDAVKVTKEEALKNMPGKGPQASEAITGRHGGSFQNFGDYSVSLFEYIDYYGDPPSRALFDMAAVAIVKDPSWAEVRSIPAPILRDNKWVERPQNTRQIMLWENFDRDRIMADFYQSLEAN
ncbi:MAG: nucleoside hydrolase, partial [Bacteroidota bacterium]